MLNKVLSLTAVSVISLFVSQASFAHGGYVTNSDGSFPTDNDGTCVVHGDQPDDKGCFAKPESVAKPKPVPVKKEPVIADADKDGVVDSLDSCPSTPFGLTVGIDGCEVDSDFDGVVDSKDRCNDTEEGAKVDANGCYIVFNEAKNIELKVNFPSNSDQVLPEYYSEIQKVSTFMKNYPNTKVVVEGYTDSRGAAAYNKALSQKRASKIAEILVSQYGIAQSRVSAQGYGEVNPVASNETASGRAANRRVVAVINTVVQKVAK